MVQKLGTVLVCTTLSDTRGRSSQ